MKYVEKTVWMFVWMMVIVFCLHISGYETFAAEKTTSWRPTYDMVLLWFNFGIIVFVFIKYAKRPLMNFLRGQKEKLAKEIEELEEEKDNITEKVNETRNILAESEVRFAELKDRIVQQGERRKKEIVESAQQQSRSMLGDANRRIDSLILQSKNAFKAELIDAAIELAMERLPQQITDRDNEKFIDQYLDSALVE